MFSLHQTLPHLYTNIWREASPAEGKPRLSTDCVDFILTVYLFGWSHQVVQSWIVDVTAEKNKILLLLLMAFQFSSIHLRII